MVYEDNIKMVNRVIICFINYYLIVLLYDNFIFIVVIELGINF